MTFGIFRNVHWVLCVLLSTCSDPKAPSCSGLASQPCRASGTHFSGSAINEDTLKIRPEPIVQVILGSFITQWPSYFLSVK